MLEGEECYSFSTLDGNLWISRKDGLPRRMIIFKPICAEILFKNSRVNLPLDEKMFVFEPRAGTWYHENVTGQSPKLMTFRPRLSTREQEKRKALFMEIDEKYRQLASFSGKFKETSQTPAEGFLTFSKPFKIHYKNKNPGLPTNTKSSLDQFYITDGYSTWKTLNNLTYKEGALPVSHKPLGNPQWFWEEIGGEPFQEPKTNEAHGVKGFFQSNTSPRRGRKSGYPPIPLFMFRPFWGVDRDYAVFLGEEKIQNNPTYKFLFYPDGQRRLNQNVETWIDKKDGFTRKWSEINATSNEVQRTFELSDVKVNMNPPPELFHWASRPGYVLEEEVAH